MRDLVNRGFTVLKFCYFEAEGGKNDKYCLHLVSAKLKIDIKLSLRVGEGRNNFEFLFITQSYFQSKVAPKLINLYVHHGCGFWSFTVHQKY